MFDINLQPSFNVMRFLKSVTGFLSLGVFLFHWTRDSQYLLCQGVGEA